jgi:hypothetical protein
VSEKNKREENVTVERSRNLLLHTLIHSYTFVIPFGLGNNGFWRVWFWFCLHHSSHWLSTGDIAFRFLNYVQSQHQRRQKRKLRAQQNLSWEEIAKQYQNDERDSLGGSHVVVCDINREMLKVGKRKAFDQGYKAGECPGADTEEILVFIK